MAFIACCLPYHGYFPGGLGTGWGSFCYTATTTCTWCHTYGPLYTYYSPLPPPTLWPLFYQFDCGCYLPTFFPFTSIPAPPCRCNLLPPHLRSLVYWRWLQRTRLFSSPPPSITTVPFLPVLLLLPLLRCLRFATPSPDPRYYHTCRATTCWFVHSLPLRTCAATYHRSSGYHYTHHTFSPLPTFYIPPITLPALIGGGAGYYRTWRQLPLPPTTYPPKHYHRSAFLFGGYGSGHTYLPPHGASLHRHTYR